MKTLGLTGGIGMGKSMAARFFRERGAQVVDTDELARQLVEPGQPALTEIQAIFGPNVVAPDGQLRRDELARTKTIQGVTGKITFTEQRDVIKDYRHLVIRNLEFTLFDTK